MREEKYNRDEILAFIRRFIRAFGCAPTLAEIRDSFGMSTTATAVLHLQKLEKECRIYRELRKPRGIHVIDQGEDYAEIL